MGSTQTAMNWRASTLPYLAFRCLTLPYGAETTLPSVLHNTGHCSILPHTEAHCCSLCACLVCYLDSTRTADIRSASYALMSLLAIRNRIGSHSAVSMG
jgi:hypothetical protein